MTAARPGARLRWAATCAAALAGAGQVGSSAASQPADPAAGRTTAKLLVDLARDYGLLRAGQQSPADVLHIGALLRAALEVDPQGTEACVWLYELSSLRGDAEGAFQALDRLVAADPQHAGAFALWLDSGGGRARDVESRRAWLEQLLASRPLGPREQAMVRVRLAQLELLRLDRDAARIQLDRALAADESLPEAALLNLGLLEADAPPRERVRAFVAALRVSPLSPELCWGMGRLLSELELPDEAARFGRRALKLQSAAAPLAACDPRDLLLLAQLEAALGDLAAGETLVRQALAGDPSLWEARFFLLWLLERRGRSEEAASLRRQLADAFERLTEPSEWPLEDVAQAAWFYAAIEPNADRALQLAQAAHRQAPSDRFVARVLGMAQALAGQTDAATVTLLPLAAEDGYAACQLARLMLAAGDVDGARRTVEGLLRVPPVGPARDCLDELDIGPPATRPAPPHAAEIAALLSGLEAGLLEFDSDPARFLRAELSSVRTAYAAGEPWRLRLTLSNRADFAITLGPERALNPVALLSFEVESDRPRTFAHLLTLSIDRVRALEPGESVSLEQTVDLGPLRRLARHAPQQLIRVTVRAILDPQRDAAGEWSPGPAGQQLAATTFVREPFMVDHARLRELFDDADAPEPQRRFAAVEVLAELLGESQRAALGRLTYRPERVPDGRIAQVLTSALAHADWETRARTLDALQCVGFDRAMLQAVSQRLSDPHWLVRLLAVRLLGERQGRPFLATAARVAGEDVNPIVRDLARSYVERWAQPAPSSQPVSAEAPAARPDVGPSSGRDGASDK